MSRSRWRSPRSSWSVATPSAGDVTAVSEEPTTSRRRPWRRRLIIALAAVSATAFLLAAVATVYLLTLPGVGDAEERVAAILARHGGRRSALPPPRRLGEAIVSTEDENFYANTFFNVAAGAGRAAVAALGTSDDPGGSTISQQLAKALYPHAAGVPGTLEEIGIGVKLSLAYSHEQVLGMYLNSIYYGNGYWGDVAAARGYFGVSPRRLTWGEASMLAGLPQAPSDYDPFRHPGLARLRQRHVLDQLVANGHLGAGQAERIFRAPPTLRGTANCQSSFKDFAYARTVPSSARRPP